LVATNFIGKNWVKMSNNSQASTGLWESILRIATLLTLVIIGAGCGSAADAAIPSQLQAVMGCDVSKVSITGVHWFREASGAWRVVGVINNGTTKSIDKLMTGVETYTKAGTSADQGEDVSAEPHNLLPGAQAPFTAWIDREIPGLDHFKIEIDECVLADPVERGRVEVRAGRMTVDDAGLAQVAGEVFNPGSKPVLVNGSMAAAYDASGTLVTAAYVDVATRSLAPGESGPIRASLNLPPGGAEAIRSFKFFMDAVITPPASLPVGLNQDVRVISHYLDASGHFHLLGQITNPGSRELMASLQATVYSNAAKTTVVDAAYFNTWIPLKPGETRPFDLTGWGALNNTQGLWDKLSKQNAAIVMRLEPFLTWPADTSVGGLALLEGSQTNKTGQVVFTGKVRNDMAGSINNGLVTAILRQKSGGQIIATGSTHLAISDSAAPGQIMEYSLAVLLPPGVDPAGLAAELSAIGQQP
jgi:hypothetical protein